MVDDIRKLVKGKSVLLVGNSVEMMKYRCAKFIDGFDIVETSSKRMSLESIYGSSRKKKDYQEKIEV